MKITPEALLDLAKIYEIIMDSDKEGLCFHVQNGHIEGLEEVIDFIDEQRDVIYPYLRAGRHVA